MNNITQYGGAFTRFANKLDFYGTVAYFTYATVKRWFLSYMSYATKNMNT